jgi:hypothetical protein
VKKSRFSEEKIISTLKEADAGAKAAVTSEVRFSIPCRPCRNKSTTSKDFPR